jgi:hypothetical protein
VKRDEQVQRNLDLAERFLHQVIDDPRMLDTIQDGTTVVLVPEDDAELAAANMETALELVQRCPRCTGRRQSGESAPVDDSTSGVYLQPICP